MTGMPENETRMPKIRTGAPRNHGGYMLDCDRVNLRHPVFTYGKFNDAASRCTSSEHFKALLHEGFECSALLPQTLCIRMCYSMKAVMKVGPKI